MFIRPLLAAMVLLTGLAAFADDEPPRNQVSFDVFAAEDVDSDLLVVRLYTQHEGREQAQAADRVNKTMAWALAEAAKVDVVKAQTLDYRTNPVYEDRRIRAWTARQSLRLESGDTGALTRLLGVLQERVAVESIGYEISPALRAAVTQRLTARAITLFRERADRIAAAFGRQGYTLMNASVGSHGGTPPPVRYAARALAMEADVAQPSIEAGSQDVRISVSGTIELAAE
ncbi:MAG: SIMPL domain-containing protein [Gammaproteobacteria bacterium]